MQSAEQARARDSSFNAGNDDTPGCYEHIDDPAYWERTLDDRYTIGVARTLDDQFQCMMVRGLVYIGEQNSPYPEEFDGNDHSATHVLLREDDEPVGALRIRYFGEFAKIERVAIRAPYQGRGLGAPLFGYAIALIKYKGYRKIYGHSQERLLSFYRKFGMKPISKPFHFSDHVYYEVLCTVEGGGRSLSLESDPMQLLRPEGRWDERGIMELSQDRDPTNPGVQPSGADSGS